MYNNHFVLRMLVFVSIVIMAYGSGQADDRTWTRPPVIPQELLDQLNNRPPAREHHTWGIFLGFGATQHDLAQYAALQQAGQLINPFTGQPFQDVKVFVFGHNSLLAEGVRIVSDHLELHVLSSWRELDGQRFDFGICHSNGCTNALNAQRQGVMRVEHFYALGTDWTRKDFRPGDLRGADVVFFAMQGDPVWHLPAPNLTVSKDRIGWQFSVPFEHLRDIPRGVQHWFTEGRADPDRFPVIRLEPLPVRAGTHRQFMQAHFILESYFPALDRWMHTESPVQKAIKERVSPHEVPTRREDQGKGSWLPPGGGGGDSGGIGGAGGSLPQLGGKLSPSTAAPDPRGGIAIPITIGPRDFEAQ